MGHALDHQGVPTGQNLVVATGADTPFTRGEELLPRRFEQGFLARIQGARYAGMPVAILEVRRAVEAPAPCRQRRLLGRQDRRQLVAMPDVVLAFLALGVGVQG